MSPTTRSNGPSRPAPARGSSAPALTAAACSRNTSSTVSCTSRSAATPRSARSVIWRWRSVSRSRKLSPTTSVPHSTPRTQSPRRDRSRPRAEPFAAGTRVAVDIDGEQMLGTVVGALIDARGTLAGYEWRPDVADLMGHPWREHAHTRTAPAAHVHATLLPLDRGLRVDAA